MSYSRPGDGNTYTECNYFSTPDKTYQGVAVGHATLADNARTFRENMATVAAYRPTKVGDGGGGGTSSLSVNPTSQSVGNSASSFSVTVAANVTWSVSKDATWITSVSPSSGSGKGRGLAVS